MLVHCVFPQDVELVQFMGKDNVPFHTVIFPATLLGTGQPWTMMRSISVTEYLNYEGGKFSKSRGTGAFILPTPWVDQAHDGSPLISCRGHLFSSGPMSYMPPALPPGVFGNHAFA